MCCTVLYRIILFLLVSRKQFVGQRGDVIYYFTESVKAETNLAGLRFRVSDNVATLSFCAADNGLLSTLLEISKRNLSAMSCTKLLSTPPAGECEKKKIHVFLVLLARFLYCINAHSVEINEDVCYNFETIRKELI